jgi:hypothetical protein
MAPIKSKKHNLMERVGLFIYMLHKTVVKRILRKSNTSMIVVVVILIESMG